MKVRVHIQEHRAKLEAIGLKFHDRQLMMDMHSGTRFEGPTNTSANMHIAAPVVVGAFTLLNMPTLANVEIGRYCSIANGVYIGSAEHPIDRLTSSTFGFNRDFSRWRTYLEKERGPQRMQVARFDDRKKTVIGHDVWLGQNAFIKAGVTIGNGAIVAAGAVVVKDVEPYTIVGGTPARFIRNRFPQEIIDQLQALQWWNYAISEFEGIDMADIVQTVNWLETNIHTIEPYHGRWWSAQELAAL
ncbi:CatB-related O-acetyltransferase [Sinorhizobium alkalisoli]|uniref:Acetyltransferase n=1 Tax=Sinorhizobium alkalisoli TaxID=1752398 RepID=A0A1E3V432_9HYPH|nr:CatB-related O-acetyltransferase [Sinorhizobium alkalisoli]ODR88353.1 hypothetical protein A8M32_25420 [Sinorhizobium alkalisoli]